MKWGWLTATSVAAVLALGRAANADAFDPAMFVTMNLTDTCSANCQAFVLGTDPISGIKTVEVELYATGSNAIPVVTAGDLLIDKVGTTTVGDVLRFENIGGQADIFIFSDNTSGLYDADVGLPPSYQALTDTITDTSYGVSPVYYPTAGEAGYCDPTLHPTCNVADGHNQPGYSLTDPTVPEPMTLSLFGAGLAGAVALRRRKRTQRA